MKPSVINNCRKIVVLLVVCGPIAAAFAADDVESSEPVKKSTEGICHAPGTAYYDQTKKFTAFKTMQECLDSGGRYPKGQEPDAGPPVKKSKNGICHDRSSAS